MAKWKPKSANHGDRRATTKNRFRRQQSESFFKTGF